MNSIEGQRTPLDIATIDFSIKSIWRFDLYNISGEIFITPNVEELTIRDCEFSQLTIKNSISKVRIEICTFKDINISNVDKINSILISGTDTLRGNVSIIKSSIQEIKLSNNKTLDNIKIKNDDTYHIDLFECSDSNITNINLKARLTHVDFLGDNKIEQINLKGKIENIDVGYDDLNVVKEKELKGEYTLFCIEALWDGAVVHLNSATIDELEITNSTTNVELYIDNIHCKKFTYEQKTLKSNGLIEFADCNSMKYIKIRKSELYRLRIDNSDFSHTYFALEKCLIEKIVWYFIQWAKEITYYNFSWQEENFVIETLRILKLNAIRNEDKINTNLFLSLENEAIRRNLGKEKKNCGDKVILCLNRVSNNHGLNPWRGICFTLGACVFWFIPCLFLLDNSYWQWGWSEWSDFWNVFGTTVELFFKALYAAHSFDYLNEYEPKSPVYVLDFIGRIFVAYGYYQTIVAFRKFNRK